MKNTEQVVDTLSNLQIYKEIILNPQYQEIVLQLMKASYQDGRESVTDGIEDIFNKFK